MSVLQQLTDEVNLAIAIGSGDPPTYVTFSGPGYSYKVLNNPERLKLFLKQLEKARNDAIRKPFSPSPVKKQITRANSERGKREARKRLSSVSETI